MNDFLKNLVTRGTPACGAFCAFIGALLAVLFLFIGFWKTLFIVALSVIGLFIGGVKDKSGFTKNTVNKMFPPKDNE